MDKLSMSLDAIIASKDSDRKSNHRGGKPNKKFQKHQPNQGQNNFQRNKFQQNKHFQEKSHVVKVAHHHNDRFGGKFQQTAALDERPMKVITIGRPKVVKPDASNMAIGTSGPSNSSVFGRLGKAGTVVVFRNLKRSVLQSDIQELCRAVGEVKEIHMQVEKGLSVARVTFANDRDATACVAKYHGEFRQTIDLFFDFIIYII